MLASNYNISSWDFKCIDRVSPEAVWQGIVDLIRSVFDATGGTVMLYEPEEGFLGAHESFSFGVPRESVSLYKVPIKGCEPGGNAARVFLSGNSYLSNKAPGDPNIIQAYVDLFNVQRIMSAPLQLKGVPFGVFHIINKAQGEWRENDLRYFSDLVRYLAPAIAWVCYLPLWFIPVDVVGSLIKRALKSRRLQDIVESMSDVLRSPIIVCDESLNVLAVSGKHPLEGEILSKLRAQIAGFEGNSARKRTHKEVGRACSQLTDRAHRWSAWINSIEVRGKVVGYLIALDNGQDTRLSPRFVDCCTGVFVLWLLSSLCRACDSEGLGSHFFQKLVGGLLTHEEALLHGLALGIDLRREWVLILARPDGFFKDKWQDFDGELKLTVVDETDDKTLIKQLSERIPNCVAVVVREGLLVLVPYEEKQGFGTIVEIGRKIRDALRSTLRAAEFSIGIGPVCRKPDDYSEALKKALRALEIGRALYGPGSVTAYSMLGVYDLLYSVAHSREGNELIKRVLGPVRNYDEQHGTQLFPTLEAYLEKGGDVLSVAREMFVHVNTVRYRIARIEELTGRNLSDPIDRFELELACRVARLLEGGVGGLGLSRSPEKSAGR